MDHTVCIGVLNPVPQPDGKKTTYLTKSEVDALNRRIRDRRYKPVPVHINHVTHKDGEPVEPCGFVWHTVMRDNGELCVAAVLFDNENGRLAKKLIEDKKNPMSEFSLGYNVEFKTNNNGLLEVTNKEATEVTLCYKGAHDTKIGKVCKVRDVVEHINKDIGVREKKGIPAKTESVTPNESSDNKNINKHQIKKMEDIVEQTGVPTHFPATRYSGNGYFADTKMQQLFTDFIDGVGKSGLTIGAKAYDGGEADTEMTDATTSAPPPTSSSSSSSSSSSNTRGIPVNDMLKKIEEIQGSLMRYKTNPEESKLGSSDDATSSSSDSASSQLSVVQAELNQITEMQNMAKAKRTPIDQLPESVREEVANARKMEDDNFEMQKADLLKQITNIKKSLQNAFNAQAPVLLKVAKEGGEGFDEQQMKGVRDFMSIVPLYGKDQADNVDKFMKVNAKYMKQSEADKEMAANGLNSIYEQIVIADQKINERNEIIENLRRETEELKARLSKAEKVGGVYSTAVVPKGENMSVAQAVKKVKSNAYANQLGGMDVAKAKDVVSSLTHGSKVALQSSMLAQPSATPETHLKRAALWSFLDRPSVERFDTVKKTMEIRMRAEKLQRQNAY